MSSKPSCCSLFTPRVAYPNYNFLKGRNNPQRLNHLLLGRRGALATGTTFTVHLAMKLRCQIHFLKTVAVLSHTHMMNGMGGIVAFKRYNLPPGSYARKHRTSHRRAESFLPLSAPSPLELPDDNPPFSMPTITGQFSELLRTCNQFAKDLLSPCQWQIPVQLQENEGTQYTN